MTPQLVSFSVALPGSDGLLAAQKRPRSKEGRERRDRNVTPDERTPCRILIVEDDWFVSMDIENVLQEAGHDVVGVVVSAEDAIETARRLRPDLVVMDIRLAGKRDGVDAAIDIRNELNIPSLFLTAYRSAPLSARADQARPIGWLTKPISGNVLVAAVDKWRAGK